MPPKCHSEISETSFPSQLLLFREVTHTKSANAFSEKGMVACNASEKGCECELYNNEARYGEIEVTQPSVSSQRAGHGN